MALFNKNKQPIITSNSNNHQQVTNNISNSYQDNVIVEFDENHTTHFKPLSHANTKEIADCLLKYYNVTVNLNVITKEDKKRLIDFLTGVMYAYNGDYKKIDQGIYYFWISK